MKTGSGGGDTNNPMEREEPISLTFLKDPLVWAVTLVRAVEALYIFVNPFWGTLWSMVLDILDAQVLLHLAGITRKQYQLWDKNVDWFVYVVELSVGASYGVYLPLFLLLFWRFLGQFMFLRTHNKTVFVFFPNFFEVAFLWLVMFHPVRATIQLTQSQPWGWLIVLLIAKQIHEFILHYMAEKYHWFISVDVFYDRILPWRKKNMHRSTLHK